MHSSVLQSFLREDCDDGETPGGGEGAQEADDVEGDLRDGGHGHTQHDGEEGEVDSPAVADPEEDSAEEDSEERHGGLHRVGVVYGDFPHWDVGRHRGEKLCEGEREQHFEVVRPVTGLVLSHSQTLRVILLFF